MNWFAQRRLDYIEFRLATVRRIRRADIARTFGVSIMQASLDLRWYIERYPLSIAYDKSAKTYYARPRFRVRRARVLELAVALQWS